MSKKVRSFVWVGFFLVAGCVSSLHARNNSLSTFRDDEGDVYIRWDGELGRTYNLQSSADGQIWSSDSQWIGLGTPITLLVWEFPDLEGGPSQLPGFPQYYFGIKSFASEGSSLIGWKGQDGQPYQVYLDEIYFTGESPPLLATDVENGGEDYRLFLYRISVDELDSTVAASLTVEALPQVEQDYLAKLTSARTQVVAELAAGA